MQNTYSSQPRLTNRATPVVYSTCVNASNLLFA